MREFGETGLIDLAEFIAAVESARTLSELRRLSALCRRLPVEDDWVGRERWRLRWSELSGGEPPW